MAKRKTISVQDVVLIANKALELAPNDRRTPEWRKGVASLLESILFSTGNYRGFNYLTWLNGGCEQWRKDGCPDFPEKEQYLGDETARYYYPPTNTPRGAPTDERYPLRSLVVIGTTVPVARKLDA